MSTPHRVFWKTCVLIAVLALNTIGARADESDLLQHLRSLVLKRVEFRDVSLDEALVLWSKSVHAQSRRKFSVRFYEGPPGAAAPPVVPQVDIPGLGSEAGDPSHLTLSLSKVSALEALGRIAGMAGYYVEFTADSVALSRNPPERLEWVIKSVPIHPHTLARAKVDFANGPLPRPQFSWEGAIAKWQERYGRPKPVSIRWNAKHDAVTLEGDWQSVQTAESILAIWKTPEPPAPPTFSEFETSD